MSVDLTRKHVGGYMPRATLAKLSRDVRNTHFKLGEVNSGFETAHKQQFQPIQGGEGTLPMPNQARQVHFALGVDSSSMKTESEAAARFKAHSLDTSTVLTQEVKNQLRAHHFGLGHEQLSYVSQHKEAFAPKGSDLNVTLDSVTRVANVRKAHFQLGLDESVKQSEARANFTPKRVEKKEELKALAERTKTQRLTNFQMGHAEQTFVSTAQQDFKGSPGQKGTLDASLEAELRRDHFVFGTAPSDMRSVTKDFFTGKVDKNPVLRPEKVREMRASHIVFGQGESSYEPTYRQFHKGGPVPVPVMKDPKTVRNSSLVLGSDRTPWTTVYSSAHQPALPPGTQLSPEAATARVSHFVLGSDATMPTSTNHRDYQRSFSTQPNRLPAEDEKALKSHHFQLGHDPAAHFSTSNTNYGASGGEPGAMDPVRKKDLQATHFQYGSAQASFETNHRSAFSQKSSPSPHHVRTQRKSNVDFGSQREAWGTTYAGTYQWIQPVPDLSYKFQIQH